MARRMISVRRIIDDLEAEGRDLEQLYIDPDDIVELDQTEDEEEE